jgi:hypothetical protein
MPGNAGPGDQDEDHAGRGMEKPMVTAPERATISYVPMIGLLKILRITPATVRRIMKLRTTAATAVSPH